MAYPLKKVSGLILIFMVSIYLIDLDPHPNPKEGYLGFHKPTPEGLF
jgi:hypothetical protein